MRFAVLLACVAVALAACEAESPPIAPTTQPETVTTTTVPSEPLVLAHSFQSGDTLVYQTELHRRVVLTTEGGPEAPLDGLPGSAEVTAATEGTVTFEVREATEAGFRLVVVPSMEEVSVEGTVDDEPLGDASDLGMLGELVSFPEEVSVDTTGALSVDRPADIIRLVSAPLTRWSGLLGPVLPGEGVRVGEEWAHAVGRAESAGRVTELETRPNGDVAVLEGTAAVPGEETDLSSFYADFLASFGEPDVLPRLVLNREPRQERWEARFDLGEGRLVESGSSTVATVGVRGVAPDPDTGEEVAFQIRLETTDELEARLVDPSES